MFDETHESACDIESNGLKHYSNAKIIGVFKATNKSVQNHFCNIINFVLHLFHIFYLRCNVLKAGSPFCETESLFMINETLFQ